MAVYDYSPDGRKLAERRDECAVTMQLELWLEARSFRLPRVLTIFDEAEGVDDLFFGEVLLPWLGRSFRVNETVFILPPGSDF